ncbi:MAG: DEAD/DEAH box helicase family protein [Planctomycetes bacterium]|nr:DEAD/DEAH box helicase family protein [Planctomycetota bacterium]
MVTKEATARIKINNLLEAAGWRFFADSNRRANVQLEPSVTITTTTLDALGDDFEKTERGFIDFLLLNEKGFPFIVLEAKSEGKDPLDGKEQSRKYARSQNCRLVILSNGNLHYLWDLERGNPYVITTFPTPGSAIHYEKVKPDETRLIAEAVGADYIALTQRPNYSSDAGWKNESERPDYIKSNKLRFLRGYQQRAVHAVQRAVKDGKDRFLFEMATGTGKTLLAAAVLKLFLRTSNASRVLFLVDRLELEEQARKNFVNYLKNDFTTVVYKENRDDWRKAEIVVSTVQSFLFNNKYQQVFSPTDFDLVISDEAHRSIGGNARAVFDYFIGYKLGLTATPRDFLKHFDQSNPTTGDPREFERRLLLDTYRTFGCENSQPTFRYSLVDGVNDHEGPFLVNPVVVDARTAVTTQLLSDDGFVVNFTDETGEDREEAFKQTQFEKRFFAGATNAVFCKTFLENALRDPVSGEIGKSIIFCVSQNHAARITTILNEMAFVMYPGKYQSDFAVQVTSRLGSISQQHAINFANNNLLGSANFIDTNRTSKARVCVTVGMMNTGYDCEDILNLALMRPIFSPTDFVQMKGRGTRLYDFREQIFDQNLKASVNEPLKKNFKLFDFFANCQYFEEEFNYDEVIKMPPPSGAGEDAGGQTGGGPQKISGAYEHLGADIIASMKQQAIGPQGMKIDRMLFQKFEETVKADEKIAAAVNEGKWDEVIGYVNREVFDKPQEYYTLDKLRRAAAVDRRITLREILHKVFGLIPGFKSKNDLLEEEFAKFVADYKPAEADAIPAIKNYFKAYITSDQVRHIIDSRQYTDLATNPAFSMKDFEAVPEKYRAMIPEYVKDYVSLNQFAA